MPAESDSRIPSREGTYNLNVLQGLGGCFVFITLRGEALGLYYGETEEAAAENAAVAITASMGLDPALTRDGG
jgi:hypothetical protein